VTRPEKSSVLRAHRRRMTVLAVLTCLWFAGGALLGGAQALAYLTPLLVFLGLLLAGRYPGAEAFERRLARAAPARRVRRASRPSRPRPARLMPRGGVLLAAGLAGRAPPLPAG
jgi:hypothetical protein